MHTLEVWSEAGDWYARVPLTFELIGPYDSEDEARSEGEEALAEYIGREQAGPFIPY